MSINAIANVSAIDGAQGVDMPYLPAELWAMIYEELGNLPCEGWIDQSLRQRSMLQFRLLSRTHLWTAWPVFGRTFFASRHIRICPTCPVKDRPELTHPILSRYMGHVAIDLIEECRVCMEEKMQREIEYFENCMYDVAGCTCCIPKYPWWDPPTDPRESEMDPREVLRQVDLILGLPELKHIRLEPDDHFRQHHSQLIEDVITSIAVWRSPTGQSERTLSIDLTGYRQCQLPAIIPPPGHRSTISMLNIDFKFCIGGEPVMDSFLLNKLLVAFPSLVKLRLNCEHHLPINWSRGWAERFGPHTSLKELQICSEKGIVYGDAKEFVGLITMFPNLTTLGLAANVLWGDNLNDSWKRLFWGAVAASKLSRVFYTPETVRVFDHLLTRHEIGWHAKFPSKRYLADLGITRHAWSGGPIPEATETGRPDSTIDFFKPGSIIGDFLDESGYPEHE
jgi:hypothetical protein